MTLTANDVIGNPKTKKERDRREKTSYCEIAKSKRSYKTGAMEKGESAMGASHRREHRSMDLMTLAAITCISTTWRENATSGTDIWCTNLRALGEGDTENDWRRRAESVSETRVKSVSGERVVRENGGDRRRKQRRSKYERERHVNTSMINNTSHNNKRQYASNWEETLEKYTIIPASIIHFSLPVYHIFSHNISQTSVTGQIINLSGSHKSRCTFQHSICITWHLKKKNTNNKFLFRCLSLYSSLHYLQSIISPYISLLV